MAQGWLEAPPAGTASPGISRDELGAPRIVTGAEGAEAMARLGYNVENMTSMLPVMNQITQSTTSLVDNAYNQALALKKSQAELAEANARTGLYGAQADNIATESGIKQQLLPLQVKGETLKNQLLQNQLDQTGIAQAALAKAQDELPAYRNEITALDYNDPQVDDKIAAIKRKYPDASTNPATEAMVSPFEQDIYNRRKSSTTFQYNSAMMAGLEKLQEQQVLPSNIDVRKEVLNGNGDQLLQQANKTIVNKRLQSLAGVANNPVDQGWIRAEQGAINNPSPEQGPMFGHDGGLNAGDDARIAAMEQKYGITPQYPGAKMTIKRTPNKDDPTKTDTEYEISGITPTTADILAAEGVGAGKGAQTPYDWSKDAEYQQAVKNIGSQPSQLRGDALTNAIIAETRRLKQAANKPWPGQEAAGGDQTNQGNAAKPAQGETPVVPVQPGGRTVPPNRRGMPLSQTDQGGGDVTGVADFFRKRGDQPITSGDDARLTTVSVGDQRWRVHREAAPAFQGFLNELAADGAPVRSDGGWNYRQKVGAQGLSEHAYGGAIDVNQNGRDEVTPEFRNWIKDHPGALQTAETHWHIYGGERFGDLGHFEWGGVPIKGAEPGTALAQARPVPSPAVPQGAREVSTEGNTSLVNSTRNDDGSISTFATNFGHDTRGQPDIYDISTLGPTARYGAWGDDLFNPQLAGVAIPTETFLAHFGDPRSEENKRLIADRRLAVVVRTPEGTQATLPIVDLGPGPHAGSHAGLDITGAGMRQLGLNDNSQVSYRIVRL